MSKINTVQNIILSEETASFEGTRPPLQHIWRKCPLIQHLINVLLKFIYLLWVTPCCIHNIPLNFHYLAFHPHILLLLLLPIYGYEDKICANGLKENAIDLLPINGRECVYTYQSDFNSGTCFQNLTKTQFAFNY